MKHLLSNLRKTLMFLTIGLLMSVYVLAQSSWPTASEIAEDMIIGWNIGNSLEVPDGETAWGNPMVNQQLIDAVNNAGFNAIRIPCAWDSYADQSTYEIDDSWLARVKEVVDYCISNGMYVVLNSHWDKGWLEEHPTYDMQQQVNEKQEAYWTQIANYFKDYDEHLLFAGTNEVHANYSEPSAENIEVQESYNQTFVDAVRATGGNNANRILVVQTYNTNIQYGFNYFSLPNDPAGNRLMVEVHYYDPYSFTLDVYSGVYTWDQATWGKEDYVDDLFSQVKQKWIDQGVPVIIGEYGVIKRSFLTGTTYEQHIASREYFLEYVTSAAIDNGITPFYWDNGYSEEFALFDRHNGDIVDQGALDALMAATGDPNAIYTLSVNINGSGSVSLSPSGGIYSGRTTVTLTANTNSGWDFIGWEGDLSGSENPVSIIMNCDKTITANFMEEGSGGSGTILREYWTNIAGTEISNLISDANYPDNPSGSEQITSLEGPVNWDDSYGTRIRGYVHPKISGTYTFWVAGDDYADLYLSTDSTSANASRIAYVEGWTNSREWNKYPSQQSPSVTLTAGEKYYIEVLHKEGYGGDNVAVAWEGPGISQAVIDGAYLSPYEVSSGGNSAPIAFVSASPTSGIVPLTVDFDASASTDPDGDALIYDWTFGDGNTATGATTSHTYDQTGEYTATVTVSDGNGGSDNASVTITVFEESGTQYTLSISTSGSGSITLDPSGGTYDEGTVVTVTAIAGDGYQFDSWSGDLTGSANPETITMDSDKSIIASFIEESSGTPCDNPESITIPFTYDGAGEYCWVTNGDFINFNSWNLDLLEINGVDFTNQYIDQYNGSMPGRIDGNYYIHYKSYVAWGHFEIIGSAGIIQYILSTEDNAITWYPNPFNGTISIDIPNPGEVESIVIVDQSGRTVSIICKADIRASMNIGGDLAKGIYVVKINQKNNPQQFVINKQ